jgi:hypothetical protein
MFERSIERLKSIVKVFRQGNNDFDLSKLLIIRKSRFDNSGLCVAFATFRLDQTQSQSPSSENAVVVNDLHVEHRETSLKRHMMSCS